jgi:hypothetical protein
VRGVLAALNELSVESAEAGPVDELDEQALRGAVGIVWACPGMRRGFGRSLARIRNACERPLPVYAVVDDDTAPSAVRGLYRAGVAGVFAWPREGLLLARYIAEMLSLRLVRGPAHGADAALARAVRAHLRHLPLAGLPLRVETDGDCVVLHGQVESLADRDEVEHRIAMMPGVASIDVGDVVVVPLPATDAEIRAACRRLIQAQIPSGTVSATVQGGRIRFEGTSTDRAAGQRLRELAARLRGVREVEIAVRTSPADTRRDRGAQRRLRSLLETLFSQARFELAYHAGVAVLDGRVPTLHIKRAMQRVLEQDAAVQRVVNKLVVER